LVGSQYASLNYIGSYYKGDNLRKIALVPLNEIQSIEEVDKALKSSANAILFIIPRKSDEKFNKLIDEIQIFLRIIY
jgi:precorrin-6x reductase